MGCQADCCSIAAAGSKRASNLPCHNSSGALSVLFASCFGCDADGNIPALFQIEMSFNKCRVVRDESYANRQILNPCLDSCALPARREDDMCDIQFEVVNNPSDGSSGLSEPIVRTVGAWQLTDEVYVNWTLLVEFFWRVID